MIDRRQRDALAEARRRAEANGHRMGEPREGSSTAYVSCDRCQREVVLLKGDPSLALSGQALSGVCPVP